MPQISSASPDISLKQIFINQIFIHQSNRLFTYKCKGHSKWKSDVCDLYTIMHSQRLLC